MSEGFEAGFQDSDASIYELAASSVMSFYGDFVDGSPSDSLAIVSERTLPTDAVKAIRASADRLGYGSDGCAWITIRAKSRPSADSGKLASAGDAAGSASVPAPDRAAKLGDQDLKTLVEALDPIAVISTDAASAMALSRAYGQTVTLGTLATLNGRDVAPLPDFPLMLADDAGKQSAWRLMKRLRLGIG